MFGPSIKVCCGPRCGTEPRHRKLYAAIEAAAPPDILVRPAMCLGLCGAGVTVVLPDGTKRKIRDTQEANAVLLPDNQQRTNNPMPTVKVLIPTPLRKFTGEQDTLMIDADSIGAMLQTLNTAHPGLGKPLMDDEGKPRRFVNLFVNGEDIRFLQNTETVLKDGDEVSIVPAIAGGTTNGTEVYNLTFHREMFNRPILQNIGKRFRLTLNIRRANLSEDAGWAEVAFTGAPDEIGRAVADLHTTGVNITGPLAQMIESEREYEPVSVGRGT